MCPCSAEEKEALDDAIMVYARENGLDEDNLEWLFHTRAKGKELSGSERAVWLELARSTPHRSPRQVWGHATRRLHAGRGPGEWTQDDKDRLRECVPWASQLGQPSQRQH